METGNNNVLQESEVTVAQLAVSRPGALTVFTKYNIDYCCGGHRTLKEACYRVGLDPGKIKREIDATPIGNSDTESRPQSWSSSFLADYIVANHHAYVRRAIEELEPLLDKVCDRHGDECLELPNIRTNFMELAEELISHMHKEEQFLFPAIKKIEAAGQAQAEAFAGLETPIDVMEHEHDIAGDLVKQMRALSSNYTPPDFACPTFRITYQRLREFDKDLMRHIHLENNILFERFKTSR
jgi:regulator of cell morphogenesis and NO signaling